MNTFRPSQEIYTRHDVEKLPVQSELIQEVSDLREKIQGMESSHEGQMESSNEIDEAVKVRIERSRQDGELIERVKSASQIMESEEGEFVPGLVYSNEVAKMQATFESRQWRGIFEGLKDGDMVMTVTEPADKIFSLKTFNDYILGQQKTDSIIGARRKILQQKLGEVGVDYVDGNFKFNTFRFREGEVSMDQITQALDEANEQISLTIMHLLEEDLSGIETLPESRRQKLVQLLDALESEGYPVRFGLSQVSGSGYLEKSVAVSEGMVAARTFQRGGKEYGQEFSEKLESQILTTFDETVEKLITEYGNTIQDSDGIWYEIFEEIPYMGLMYEEREVEISLSDKREGEDGAVYEVDGEQRVTVRRMVRREAENEDQVLYRKVINKDLVRAVRKGKFTPMSSQDGFSVHQAALELVQEYVSNLNTIDLVRPYTATDLVKNSEGVIPLEQVFQENHEHFQSLGEFAEGNISEETPQRLLAAAEYLEGAMKHQEFTNKGIFHERVSLMDRSAILAIDVGDLGVDVLRTYEEDLFAVRAGMLEMSDVFAKIGDRETYAMNSIREKIVHLYKDVFGERMQEGEKIVGLVEGGDEVVLAFDLSIDGESVRIDEFRRRLQDEVGVPIRVVLTSHEAKRIPSAMQSISEKNFSQFSGSGEIDPRLEAHILSMDRSEKGADASKTCEAQVRKIRKLLE